MRDRRVSPAIAIFAAVALCAPLPAAQGKSFLVADCNGGMSRIDVPMAPGKSDQHECCRKSCHAAGDRRKKSADNRRDCC